MLLLIVLLHLVVFSLASTILSVIFMLSLPLFRQIEEVLQVRFGDRRGVVTALEGEIDFINDWIVRNRLFFGPVFSVLAAMNTRSMIFLLWAITKN